MLAVLKSRKNTGKKSRWAKNFKNKLGCLKTSDKKPTLRFIPFKYLFSVRRRIGRHLNHVVF